MGLPKYVKEDNLNTEETGFEPAVPCGTLPFQDSALDQLCDSSLNSLFPFKPELLYKRK